MRIPKYHQTLRRRGRHSLRNGSQQAPKLCFEALEDRTLLSVQPMLLADINQNTAGSYPSDFVAAGGINYTIADDGIHGLELWKTGGTATGTVLVKDINPGRTGSYPAFLTNVNGTLFFRQLVQTLVNVSISKADTAGGFGSGGKGHTRPSARRSRVGMANMARLARAPFSIR